MITIPLTNTTVNIYQTRSNLVKSKLVFIRICYRAVSTDQNQKITGNGKFS